MILERPSHQVGRKASPVLAVLLPAVLAPNNTIPILNFFWNENLKSAGEPMQTITTHKTPKNSGRLACNDGCSSTQYAVKLVYWSAALLAAFVSRWTTLTKRSRVRT